VGRAADDAYHSQFIPIEICQAPSIRLYWQPNKTGTELQWRTRPSFWTTLDLDGHPFETRYRAPIFLAHTGPRTYLRSKAAAPRGVWLTPSQQRVVVCCLSICWFALLRKHSAAFRLASWYFGPGERRPCRWPTRDGPLSDERGGNGDLVRLASSLSCLVLRECAGAECLETRLIDGQALAPDCLLSRRRQQLLDFGDGTGPPVPMPSPHTCNRQKLK